MSYGTGDATRRAPPAGLPFGEQGVSGARDLPVVQREHGWNPTCRELVDNGESELVIDVVQVCDVWTVNVQQLRESPARGW